MKVTDLVTQLNTPHVATGAFTLFEVRGRELVQAEFNEYALPVKLRVTAFRWHSLWAYPGSIEWMRHEKMKPDEVAQEIADLPSTDDDIHAIAFKSNATLALMREVADALGGKGRVDDGVLSLIRLD